MKPIIPVCIFASIFYQKDEADWRTANPPRPRNHTIWLKPHRGSRYLKSETDSNK